MADGGAKVAEVLRQAAARAERHAVLDSAVTSMEALLNYPLPPEMLPWGSAMSTSYFAINSAFISTPLDDFPKF